MPPRTARSLASSAAHGQFQLLRLLLSFLDDERNDVFIHIDAKVTDAPYESLKASVHHAGLYFIPERQNLGWGRPSQCTAELSLYTYAYAHGPYQHYCLMSGACLPIKSQDYIHVYLGSSENRERIFIAFQKQETLSRFDREWVQLYHFQGICRHVRLLTKFQRKFFHVDRLKKNFPGYEFRKGSTWCCLTHEAVAYLLNRRADIEKLIWRSVCADEIYRQFFLYNDPGLRAKIMPGDMSDLWLLHWNGGVHPDTLTMEDVPELLASPKLFARKFSEEHMDAVKAVCEHVRGSAS